MRKGKGRSWREMRKNTIIMIHDWGQLNRNRPILIRSSITLVALTDIPWPGWRFQRKLPFRPRRRSFSFSHINGWNQRNRQQQSNHWQPPSWSGSEVFASTSIWPSYVKCDAARSYLQGVRQIIDLPSFKVQTNTYNINRSQTKAKCVNYYCAMY
jgi:hypothetical protein